MTVSIFAFKGELNGKILLVRIFVQSEVNIGQYRLLSLSVTHTLQSTALYGNASMAIDNKLICHVMEIALVQEIVTRNYYPLRPISEFRQGSGRTSKTSSSQAYHIKIIPFRLFTGSMFCWYFASIQLVRLCCDTIGFYQIRMSQVSSLELQPWLQPWLGIFLELFRTATLMILNK